MPVNTTLLHTALISAMAAGALVGGYSAMSDSPEPRVVNQKTSASSKDTINKKTSSFTAAQPGQCLTWDINEDGTTSNFGATDCAEPHRFEISSREDLATYPSSEFGPGASAPDLTRQAQLREELCSAQTVAYLGGRYDPSGIYSIASILPPPEAWRAGDRTMLCGLQHTDDRGTILLSEGKAKNQDQALTANAGDCISIDAANGAHTVACEEPHSYEVTSKVNLANVFDHPPSVEEQDEHLKNVCTQAAMDYMGGDDPLYFSTLAVYWTTLPVASWNAGSHSANCALFRPNADGGFATLQGSAKGPFTIDGQPPEQRPTRNPLREQ